jgi:hypothetical protein
MDFSVTLGDLFSNPLYVGLAAHVALNHLHDRAFCFQLLNTPDLLACWVASDMFQQPATPLVAIGKWSSAQQRNTGIFYGRSDGVGQFQSNPAKTAGDEIYTVVSQWNAGHILFNMRAFP